jgi:hypothetical protein
MGSPQRRREKRGVEVGESTFGFIEAPDQEKASNLEIPGVRSIYFVAMRFKGRSRSAQYLRSPAKVTRDKCDLGLRDVTPRASHRFL